MKLSRLIEPYKENGKSNLGFCNKQSGVYLIYKNGKLRYIGYSGYNVYKTLTRHFQEWDSKGKPVVTYVREMRYNDFKVRVCLCSPGRAAKLERALIMKYKPVDNRDKLRGETPTDGEKKTLRDFNNAEVLSKKEMEEAPF